MNKMVLLVRRCPYGLEENNTWQQHKKVVLRPRQVLPLLQDTHQQVLPLILDTHQPTVMVFMAFVTPRQGTLHSNKTIPCHHNNNNSSSSFNNNNSSNMVSPNSLILHN